MEKTNMKWTTMPIPYTDKERTDTDQLFIELLCKWISWENRTCGKCSCNNEQLHERNVFELQKQNRKIFWRRETMRDNRMRFKLRNRITVWADTYRFASHRMAWIIINNHREYSISYSYSHVGSSGNCVSLFGCHCLCFKFYQWNSISIYTIFH